VAFYLHIFCVIVLIGTAKTTIFIGNSFRILSDSRMYLHFLSSTTALCSNSCFPSLCLSHKARGQSHFISRLPIKTAVKLVFYTTRQASSFCNTNVIKFYLILCGRGGQTVQPHFTRQLTQELHIIKIKYPPPRMMTHFCSSHYSRLVSVLY
jgi:hypothetical protein